MLHRTSSQLRVRQRTLVSVVNIGRMKWEWWESNGSGAWKHVEAGGRSRREGGRWRGHVGQVGWKDGVAGPHMLPCLHPPAQGKPEQAGALMQWRVLGRWGVAAPTIWVMGHQEASSMHCPWPYVPVVRDATYYDSRGSKEGWGRLEWGRSVCMRRWVGRYLNGGKKYLWEVRIARERERERERERDCKVLLENIDHQFSIFFLVLDPTNVPWMLVVSISFVLVVVEWGGGGVGWEWWDGLGCRRR